MRDIKVISKTMGPLKTAKGHQIKKKREKEKRKGVRDNREFGYIEVQDLDEPVMLRWRYLLNPPLDDVDFWIYGSYHTPL